MNARNTDAFRRKFLRVLTLACFFNFSGLNNGFTYFIVSQGHVQRFDFAPLLVQKAARALNPASWNRGIIQPLLSRASRSRQVIRFASRRAVQNLVSESTTFQAWVNEGRLKLLNSPSKTQENTVISPQAMTVPVSGQPALSEPNGSRVLARPAAGFKASSALPRLGTDSTRTHLKDGRRTWLMDRCHFWNGHKDIGKWGAVFRPVDLLSHSVRAEGPPVGGLDALQRRHPPEKLMAWLVSSPSRGGDDPFISLLPRVAVNITLSRTGQGDFLLSVGVLS